MRWRHEDACSSRHGKRARVPCSGGDENGRFPPTATCAVVVRNDPFTSKPVKLNGFSLKRDGYGRARSRRLRALVPFPTDLHFQHSTSANGTAGRAQHGLSRWSATTKLEKLAVSARHLFQEANGTDGVAAVRRRHRRASIKTTSGLLGPERRRPPARFSCNSAWLRCRRP